MIKFALQCIFFLCVSFSSYAASFYPIRLDDSQAVYLTPDDFPVHADGQSDDSEAVQAAINKVQETTGEGILFVPEGQYRITRTIYVWPRIRVIGYGAQHPIFVLPDNTPGLGQGIGYMFFFTGSRPVRKSAPPFPSSR
jgi:Pectate lyase superfamily protein